MLTVRNAELIHKGKEVKTELQVIPVHARGKWGHGTWSKNTRRALETHGTNYLLNLNGAIIYY